MSIYDMEIDEECIISKIEGTDTLKYKFLEFGLKKGIAITMTNFSLSKKNINIKVRNTIISLRNYEARNILVSKL